MRVFHVGQWICGAAWLILTSAFAAEPPKVLLNEADFRDRVFACWLGKNIGGTLGMPFEGKREPQNISFYTNLKSGEPAANDDLDLQILWLKALQEHDGRVDARILGEYWLKYVPVDWNEYGVGKRNLRLGLLPPLSGEYNNAQWKHSNGAWIRSEIWACLAPGCPALATQMAREDACVDHGAAEGTLAEIFTAAIESAAFIEKDRDRLIAIGLSMIPANSQLAGAIRAAVDAKKAGKDWKAAREDVIQASARTGWFQAPRNVAYTMLGWLYGEGDFGKSLCIAVGCGDDTDCTGATLGSIFGILHGTRGIPENWSQPVGLKIKTVAIAGFEHANDLNELTDQTVAMTKKVLALREAPVGLTNGPADLSRAGELVLSDPDAVRSLWNLSPYRIVWNEPDVQAELDYLGDPILTRSVTRAVRVTIRNQTKQPVNLALKLANVPGGWFVEGLPPQDLLIVGEAAEEFKLRFTAAVVEPEAHQMRLEITGASRPIRLPITLLGAGRDTIEPGDLALAAKGAVATSDSELDREPGCTPKVIDGVLATAEDFSNRWHSSLKTAHPHWVEVKLPKPALIGRVVVRFADPAGHPISFQGFVTPQGESEPKPVFEETDYQDRRIYRAKIEPVLTDTFRLMVRGSANRGYANAAQVSEIELYPAEP